jgi:hypothetical protein
VAQKMYAHINKWINKNNKKERKEKINKIKTNALKWRAAIYTHSAGWMSK